MGDFSDKPTLHGERIVLRPVAESDAEGLADLVADPEGRRLTGEYAGEIVLNKLDRPNRSCALRIALRRDYRDRGLGGEAVRLVLAHAFGTVGLHRVELEVYAFNARAQAVYERAGFVREGVRRDALYWDGEYTDAITMAILAPDWHASHGGDPRSERTR
ncbi:MAG: hypothetical protein QOJ50_239 [Cryptosporangiaceae bacterium]|jgi:RimJ/RimL family protein N-acetyltransferase|nr:hypothetical protein [Cryptosporangiaceae bacterium]